MDVLSCDCDERHLEESLSSFPLDAPIYLDHHATTPCDPRVVDAMLPYFTTEFGNPSSLTHQYGRRASNAIEDARIVIARFLRIEPNEIVFTAGATESNNTALSIIKTGEHAITSATEHRSVLLPLERARERGAELTILTPDSEGLISIDAVRDALRPNTRLVSIEAANSEIGMLQPVAAIGAFCRERGILFHSDITQAAGKIDLDLANVDLASWSAHKLYGPKGIGGLFIRRGARIEPLLLGGGQEKGHRSGTLNVPAIIGMSAAFTLRAEEMHGEGERLTALRNDLWQRIMNEIDGTSVNGPRGLRLPGNLNVSFERVEADSLILAMRHFALSSGSACSSGERGRSRILAAIGSPFADLGSVRIGLGKSNTAAHIAMLVDDFKRAVARLREISAA
jgi:cysteine desulfurase